MGDGVKDAFESFESIYVLQHEFECSLSCRCRMQSWWMSNEGSCLTRLERGGVKRGGITDILLGYNIVLRRRS
jgi:hypothetical protein